MGIPFYMSVALRDWSAHRLFAIPWKTRQSNEALDGIHDRSKISQKADLRPARGRFALKACGVGRAGFR